MKVYIQKFGNPLLGKEVCKNERVSDKNMRNERNMNMK